MSRCTRARGTEFPGSIIVYGKMITLLLTFETQLSLDSSGSNSAEIVQSGPGTWYAVPSIHRTPWALSPPEQGAVI